MREPKDNSAVVAATPNIYASKTTLTASVRVPDVPLHTVHFLRESHHRHRPVHWTARARVLADGGGGRRGRLRTRHRQSVAADLQTVLRGSAAHVFLSPRSGSQAPGLGYRPRPRARAVEAQR